MAEALKSGETWRPNVPPSLREAEKKYGGHDEAAAKDVEAPEQPNPSDPGNTGTTPGSNADVG